MFRIIHAMYSYKSFVIGVNILVSQSTCILLSARSIIVADLGPATEGREIFSSIVESDFCIRFTRRSHWCEPEKRDDRCLGQRLKHKTSYKIFHPAEQRRISRYSVVVSSRSIPLSSFSFRFTFP